MKTSSTPAAQHSERVLRSEGLRVTAARVAVLDVLAEHEHLTADEVTSATRARIGSVSAQAIYHVLGSLSEAGLLRRFEPAGSAVRYERRVGDNHHHLVCRGCGRVVDVDCGDDHQPCVHPRDDHGFAVDEAEIVFWGSCPDCRTKAAKAARRRVS